MRVVVTGAAGFIGSHLCQRLVDGGHEVVGLDSLTDYYDVSVKRRNLEAIGAGTRFGFHHLDLRVDRLEDVLDGADAVVNEAAMPGLRWDRFDDYVSCNLAGLQRLVEACRKVGVGRFVQASTSSVYGATALGDESQPTDPVSPYGVTKLAAETLLRAYGQQFGFPAVVLRYFSIYGPRQRPDMAYHRFIEAMLDGRPITILGDGEQTRGNTYVDDCVTGTVLALTGARAGETYNIGGGVAISVLGAVDVLADALGVTPELVFEAPRPGDQRCTLADISKASAEFGYRPQTSPEVGLRRQAEWQRSLRAG